MYNVDELKRTLPYVLKLEFRNVDGKNEIEAFGQLDGRRVVVDVGPEVPTSTDKLTALILKELPPTEADLKHYKMSPIKAPEPTDSTQLDEDALDETGKLFDELAKP